MIGGSIGNLDDPKTHGYSRNDAPVLPPTIYPPVPLAQFLFPGRLRLSETYPSLTLTATVLTPNIMGDYFQYRHNVQARISLSGNVSPRFEVIIGHPPHNETQRVDTLWLTCFASCQSCTSRDSSLSPQSSCNPVEFYLNPSWDLNNKQGFTVDHMSDSPTLNGNVTFKIELRPRNPRAEDRVWRCASESLM